MIERITKREIHCPVCGKCLLKAGDGSEIEIKCDKCGSDIIAVVRNGMISTMEDRKNKLPKRKGAVSVSVVKNIDMKSKNLEVRKKATNF